MKGLELVLAGTATVHCVHDRQKRRVNDEVDVRRLGLEVGQVYNPAQHKLHRCACCDNLFVDPTDEPRFCGACTVRPLAHPLGGPLPVPIGAVA